MTSKSEAESAIYDDLREETNGLHATLVQKAIKRATDDIDNCYVQRARSLLEDP